MSKSLGRDVFDQDIGRPASPYTTGGMHDNSSTTERSPQPTPPSFSIGQRLRQARDDGKRGPGAYMGIWEQSHGPAFSFRKKTSESKDDGPGPGEYQSGSGYTAIKASSPAYSMGARCGPTAFGTPGPGAYDVDRNNRGQSVAYPTSYKAGIGFSRGPGPGTYNSSLKSGSPAFSMGRRTRINDDRIDSPGPGAYDVQKKPSAPSYSIAPKVRTPVSQRDMNPGPGTYSEDTTASQTRGLAFTMRERFRS